MMRVGIGYDSHRFTSGDVVPIGGVKIPFSRGVQAHSDGDVLLHALMDALLGSVALGDIGQHFPDTDPQYQHADSIVLLKHVMRLLHERGYRPINVDAVVICEAPKLQPHISAMVAAIAPVLGLTASDVSVKATTNERMGWIGREEGLAAQVVVGVAPCDVA